MIKHKKIFSLSLVVLFFEVVFLFGASVLNNTALTEHAYAQQAVTPTLYCLGACPTTPLSPGVTNAPSAATSVAPSGVTTTSTTSVAPSVTVTGVVASPVPSTTPCATTTFPSLGIHQSTLDHSHHHHGGGFLSFFFELILVLIYLLLQQGGLGTGVPCPTTVVPTPSTVTLTSTPSIVVPSNAQPTVTPTVAVSGTPTTTTQPIAVVYSDNTTGPSDGDDTAAMIALLKSDTKHNFKIITAGPNGSMTVQQALAQPGVVLYGSPGASGDDVTSYQNQKGDTTAIQNFVKNGGHYLGICMGQFLAEPDHFNIFSGQINDYDDKYGKSHAGAVLPITWRGKVRKMYFQDGGFMVPNANAQNVTVLAKFATGEDAALVASYGKGKVGLSGPHPEAPQAWYSGLADSDGLDADLGRDLIDTLMQ